MYSVELEKEGVMSISQEKERFTYKIHGLTNYPDYRFSHPFIFIKKNLLNGSCSIIESLPVLPEKWKYGNFIHHEGFEYRRLTQYEFDKFCSENREFKTRFPDNGKLFDYISSKN